MNSEPAESPPDSPPSVRIQEGASIAEGVGGRGTPPGRAQQPRAPSAEADDDSHLHGPFLVDVQTHSTGAEHEEDGAYCPARVLDRGVHAAYLSRQSDFCFVLPAIDPKHPAHTVYLQFDALQQDIREAWLGAVNTLFQRTCTATAHHTHERSWWHHHHKHGSARSSPRISLPTTGSAGYPPTSPSSASTPGTPKLQPKGKSKGRRKFALREYDERGDK